MKILLILLYSSLLTLASPPRAQVNAFFKSLKTKDVQESLTTLFSTNKGMEKNAQQLTLMATQIETAFKLYGKPESTDEVSKEEITERVLRISEISNHKHHPLNWEFFFYKIDDTWVISQLRFGDQFQYIQ